MRSIITMIILILVGVMFANKIRALVPAIPSF